MKAPYTVKQVIKFGMLFGYKIVDADGKDIGYEFDETEKEDADRKCDLSGF